MLVIINNMIMYNKTWPALYGHSLQYSTKNILTKLCVISLRAVLGLLACGFVLFEKIFNGLRFHLNRFQWISIAGPVNHQLHCGSLFNLTDVFSRSFNAIFSYPYSVSNAVIAASLAVVTAVASTAASTFSFP